MLLFIIRYHETNHNQAESQFKFALKGHMTVVQLNSW